MESFYNLIYSLSSTKNMSNFSARDGKLYLIIYFYEIVSLFIKLPVENQHY